MTNCFSLDVDSTLVLFSANVSLREDSRIFTLLNPSHAYLLQAISVPVLLKHAICDEPKETAHEQGQEQASQGACTALQRCEDIAVQQVQQVKRMILTCICCSGHGLHSGVQYTTRSQGMIDICK